jgi:hypothetical protein
MKLLVWLVAVGCVAGIVVLLARLFARWGEKRKASEARFASFIAQARPQVPAAAALPPAPAPEEELLLDAGVKAGQAGEPALAIQLYTRLLARYPHSRLAPQAQAGVMDEQKKLAQA